MFLLSLIFSVATAQASCDRPWIFFDLGDVLIDTRDWSRLRHEAGAAEYLSALHTAGFKLGIITNVPESWGSAPAAKLSRLQEEIAATWVEDAPFRWGWFEAILTPPDDARQKPHPYLFDQARALAGDCPALYQGENDAEVEAAKRQGLETHHVGSTPGHPEFKKIAL